jgi:ABC-type transport system substrate-binding protein
VAVRDLRQNSGADELAEAAKKSGTFDYGAKVGAWSPRTPYTLRVRLKETDYNFGYVLAMVATSAQAREVVEAYEDTNAHPVGTGPYVLKKWVRGSKIILEANPDYRPVHMGFPARQRSGRPDAGQRNEGQEDAADRRRRHQRHGGRPEPLARVPGRAARLS